MDNGKTMSGHICRARNDCKDDQGADAMTGVWNRAGRRSGGNLPLRIGANTAQGGKILSIQCHERRHGECSGTCRPFFPVGCECPCHKGHTP
jgi:hypothetical protein